MTEKKLTTGGFFRKLIRLAVTGGDSENPITTVIQKGLEHGKETSEAKVIQAEGEEVPQEGHQHVRRTSEAPGAEKA